MANTSPTLPLAHRTLPSTFGRYEVTRLLGEGGMARVFLATLQGVGGFRKDVALKVLKSIPDGEDPNEDWCMSREARLCGLLKHPHIVDTYDFGEEDGEQYIAMEVITGTSIRDLLMQLGQMPISVVLEIASQVCDGLVHAHGLEVNGQQAGLVHRDLTPGNIMVTQSGYSKLMDFGLARADLIQDADATTEQLRGTPPYMSPEQISKAPVDHRSDLFSLGAILYEMATGSRLFQAPTSLGILLKVDAVETRLSKPGALGELDALCPGLTNVVRGCLRRDPSERVANAEALRKQVEDLRRNADRTPTLRDFIEETLSGDITQTYIHGENTGLIELRPAEAPVVDWDEPTEKTQRIVPVARTNVGAEQSHFIGRSRDLSQVQSLFEEGRRLVTLIGPGGSGKTRLAHRYAKNLLQGSSSQRQVWWCDLRTARSLDAVVQAVSNALSLTTVKGKTAPEQVEHIGQALAERPPITLILDNFEQVAALASASIGRWMGLSPQTRFLVTSQLRLSIPGETCHALGGLSSEEAIDLFCDRAESIGADGPMLRADGNALQDLMERLDHLPLAIELAAAHTRVFTPAQILERLSSRFRLLRDQRTESLSHHQSLEETLDWSWDLLQPWEKACLAQLSAFSGGFFMEAVENVVDLRSFPEAPWVIFVVESLVDRSLVQASSAQGGQVRFELYNTVAEYAEARLEDEGRIEAWRRHGEWYSQYGTVAEIQALRAEGGTRRLDDRFADRANFSAAVNRAIDNGWTEIAVLNGLMAALILNNLGPLDASIAMSERLINMPGLTQKLRCRTLLNASWSLFDVDFQGAINNFEEALRLSREMDDPTVESACLSNIAVAYHRIGNLEVAKERLEQCVQLCDTHGLDGTLATAMINLGNVYDRMGHHEEALMCYNRALKQGEAVGDLVAVCLANTNLGDIYRTLGKPQRARDHLDQGLAMANKIKHDRKQVFLLCNHVELDLDEGEFNNAQPRLAAAKAIAEAFGEPRLIGIVLRLEATLYLRKGELQTALSRAVQAEEILTSKANSDLLLLLLCIRMDIELASKSMDSARKTMDRIEALEIRLAVSDETDLSKNINRLRAAIA